MPKSRSEARGYAAFLQNAGFFIRGDSQGLHPGLVCEAPSGHFDGNAGASGSVGERRGASGLARGSRAYGRPREMGCCQDSRHPVWS